MLSQFTGQQKSNGSLDFPACDGGSLVVVSETGGLCGDPLENVVDKTVHDGHGFAADTGIGVNLFQDFVDVDAVRLLSSPLSFLVP